MPPFDGQNPEQSDLSIKEKKPPMLRVCTWPVTDFLVTFGPFIASALADFHSHFL